MKRRNVEFTKIRRPIKPRKISEGLYHNLLMYLKLFVLWMCVMGGDFMVEFRLEYLYPFYLLILHSYEAYKFQSTAFALLLVCIVVSVDFIALGVIPAHWLFLLGSLLVWGQVSWSLTPLGPLILIPTLIYIDGRAIRPHPSPQLIPLAAHCVGFPLVSLGFGLKSYIGNILKQRTKNDVARQNELLYSVLWEALPPSPPPSTTTNSIGTPPPLTISAGESEVVIKNGDAVLVRRQGSSLTNGVKLQDPHRRKSIEESSSFSFVPNGSHHHHLNNANSLVSNPFASSGVQHPPSSSANYSLSTSRTEPLNHCTTPNSANNLCSLNSNSIGVLTTTNTGTMTTHSWAGTTSSSSSSSSPTLCVNCNGVSQGVPKRKKDDCCIKQESEVRRLRSELRSKESDLHALRAVESEIRSQVCSLLSSERNLRSDLGILQGEHESLQLKYSALHSKGQEERQNFEKRLSEERRSKESAVNKQKKASQENSGDFTRKLRDADKEKESLRREVKLLEEKNARTERELQNVKSTLMQHEQVNTETARLVSLLTALQDQNAHLEASLSAETRLKLDLFSALGEARRQLSIRESIIKSKNDELENLKMLAVTNFGGHGGHLHRDHATLVKNMNSISMGNGNGDCPSNSSPQSNQSLTFSPLIES